MAQVEKAPQAQKPNKVERRITPEKISYAEMDFETAVGYLAAVVKRHREKNPILTVVMGDQNSGTTHFSKELIEAISREDADRKRLTYALRGLNEKDIQELRTVQEGHPNADLALLIIENTAAYPHSGVDIGTLREFRRFPEFFIFLYNPGETRLNPEGFEENLRNMVQERKTYAANQKIPFTMSEVIIVRNPKADKK